MKSEQGTPFALWLNGEGLTYEDFARTIDVSSGAVYAWAAGIRTPHTLAKNAIRAKFPECPLLVEGNKKMEGTSK